MTVVVGVKNRVDHKLRNTLRSIARQVVAGVKVEALVVDYDNDSESAKTIDGYCREFGATHLRITNRAFWSKPHCYNIGIRLASTKYVMSCDADILLSETFVRTAVDLLRTRPLSVVYSRALDLPETSAATVERWGDIGSEEDLLALKTLTTPRSIGDCNPGILITYGAFFHMVGGYDEFYREWGFEDSDLQKRFMLSGLEIVSVKDRTFYLHQWHPKFASLDVDSVARVQERNRRYYEGNWEIRRNLHGWGDPAWNSAAPNRPQRAI